MIEKVNDKNVMHVSEQLLKRIDKFEDHFNSGMEKLSDVMTKIGSNEEKMTNMLGTLTNVQGQINMVVQSMHEMQLQMARDLATNEDVKKVHSRIDNMGVELNEVKSTSNFVRNIGGYIVSPVIVLIVSYLLFGKQ